MPIDLTAFRSALPPQVGPFLARLTSLGAAPQTSALPVPASATVSPPTLTPASLRASLLQIGVTPDGGNLLLAEAFSQIGIALLPASFTEAHICLAQAPGAAPLAYALARSLGLPTSPDVLRALSAVAGGIPPERALPIEVTEWLSLAVTPQEPQMVAEHLALMLDQRASSTERRLVDAAHTDAPPSQDTRSLLLALARAGGADRQVRLGADTLAAHIEGQQLANLAAQRDGTRGQPMPLYFALPLLLPGEQTMLEMSVPQRPLDREDGWDEAGEEAGWRTTIRLATSRLGRIEAELSSTPPGGLCCRLAAEKPGTARLLERAKGDLAAALVSAGWPRCDVACRTKTDWPPLWHGGEALTAPRARIDWEA